MKHHHYHTDSQSLVNKASDLPAEVQQVIKDTFTIPSADADLKSFNDSFAQKHASSAPHLQAAYAARFALDPASKSQNEADLIKTLDLQGVSFEQAAQGLELLGEWKSEEGVKGEYKKKAGEKWSEAGIFKA